MFKPNFYFGIYFKIRTITFVDIFIFLWYIYKKIKMNIDEAIKRLKGILCGDKGTSCPDQLAKALEKIKNC